MRGPGGRCLSDLSVLRWQGEVFGPVASDPTVCRLVKTLAGDVEAVEAAVEAARGRVRRRVWSLAGQDAPTAGISAASPLVIDVDATLVEVHSAKEEAAPTGSSWVLWGVGCAVAGGAVAVVWLRWWRCAAAGEGSSGLVRWGRVRLRRLTHWAVAVPGVVAAPRGPSRRNGPRARRGSPGARAAAPA